jgi:hypothetical protein
MQKTKIGTVTWPDYEEGKEKVKNYKHVASALKKRSDVSI